VVEAATPKAALEGRAGGFVKMAAPKLKLKV
jgi:hypothetical protein